MATHSKLAPSAFMQRALEIADQPKLCVLPNPRVGAVIVHQNQIIAEGFHRGPGTAHAELAAVRSAVRKGFKNFKAYDIYISLEPCCHTQKKTPPCAPLLIEKNFKKVFIAHKDPNPAVSGKGIRSLRAAGLSVEIGLLRRNAEKLNQSFIKNQTQQLPYISLKMAMSFDGKMATDSGTSKWISSEKSRKRVHELRARVDAIGVGALTFEKDDPQLNARLNKQRYNKKIIVFGPTRNFEKSKAVKANGLKNIIQITRSGLKLKDQLRWLYLEKGICHILLEGGPKIASSFLEQDLVDELKLFYGSGIFGGKGLFSLGREWALKSPKDSVKFRPETAEIIGTDLYLQGALHVYRTGSKNRKN